MTGEVSLFYANTTKQNHEVQFRLPANPRVIVKKCPPLAQILLHRGSQEDIDAIIKQIEKYGARPASLVSRVKDFVGATYSVDAGVKAATIGAVVEHNDNVLTMQAKENRKFITQAIHVKLNETAQEGGPDVPRVGHVQTEIEEVVPLGAEASMGRETLEVSSEGVKPRGGRRKAA